MHHATSDDVSKATNALSSSAISSIDKMSLKLLRLSLPVIASPLSHIFNMSIDTDSFSTSWKIGQIIPVFKKGNRSDYRNYRPITLLPLLSKALEHIVHGRLKAYLDNSNIIHPSQHGFRAKHYCALPCWLFLIDFLQVETVGCFLQLLHLITAEPLILLITSFC